MTGEELREIEEREKAATPGPWMTEKPDDDALDARPAVVGEKRRTRVGTERPIIVNDAWAPDAVFIAAARSDIPALCDEVRRLVKALSDVTTCESPRDMFDTARDAIEGYEVTMANRGAREANAELRHGELVAAIERIDRLRLHEQREQVNRSALLVACDEQVQRAEAAEADLAASLAREGEQGEALIAVKCDLVGVRGVIADMLAEIACTGPDPFSPDLRARAEAEVWK